MNKNAKYQAEKIAKWFLAYNRLVNASEDADLISNLKLQKLLYYAQGCFLALTDTPIFQDDILAWEHGPVVENVYHKYKSNGAKGIEFEDGFHFEDFSEEENNLLRQVYEEFGQYSAWKLRNMTHEERPWKETKRNFVIPIDLIKDYFVQEYVDYGSEN